MTHLIMAEKKIVQFPRYLINEPRHVAIDIMKNYISEHYEDFANNEEITIGYKDIYGNTAYANAIVKNDGGDVTLNVEISDVDTLKVVESDTEPEDNSVLWLSNDPGEDEPEDLRAEISLLRKRLQELETIVNRHDYALSNTVAGGDIVTNSEKYDIENQAIPERPSVVTGGTATGDTDIARFELCIGDTLLSDYKTFYAEATYYLKPKCYNENGELIDYSEAVKKIESINAFSTVPSVAEVYNRDGKCCLKGKTEGKGNYTTVFGEIITTDGRLISTLDYQGIKFEVAEKPDYETYVEPNIHHMLIKTAETYDILKANLNYLCVNELIWCNGDNSLYFKAKAKDGSIQLFKINGQGSDPVPPTPTGDTTGITFTVKEDNIDVVTNNTGITVNENGYLTLPGTVNENGYLVLSNSSGNTEIEFSIDGDSLDLVNTEAIENNK